MSHIRRSKAEAPEAIQGKGGSHSRKGHFILHEQKSEDAKI